MVESPSGKGWWTDEPQAQTHRGFPQAGRPHRRHGRRRFHRRLPRPLLPRQGLQAHPGRRQEAPLRLVPAHARRREPLPRPQRAGDLRARLRGGGRGLPARRRHGRHGLHRALPGRVPAERPHQHPHDRGRLAGRRRPLLLFVLGLRLQHRPPEGLPIARPQGVGRLPGQGRARLRLGEAFLRDLLPGILGRARPADLDRPLPQRLRPPRDLGRRPREGAGGPLPQGPRGPGERQRHRRDLGRRPPDAELHVHRRLRRRHRHDRPLRRARRDAHQPGLERARLGQRPSSRSSRRRPASRSSGPTTRPPRKGSAAATPTTR